MFEYHAQVLSSEPSADGTLHLDCVVERREVDPPDPENNPWVAVPLGHRTVVLSAASVQGVLDANVTDNQKRTALIALLRAEILLWGIDEADQAEQGLKALVPGESWPVSVPL